MEQQKITLEGRQLAYWDIGEGPAILFGHSFLWDKEMWRPQIEVLSQHYRCIVPDLWAHGGSEPLPDSTLHLADIAVSMQLLMERLQIDMRLLDYL